MYLYCTAAARAGVGGNHNGFLGFLSAVAFKWYTLTTNDNIVCSYIVYVCSTYILCMGVGTYLLIRYCTHL